MSHNSHSHWSPHRDNDNPFEKYKSQRNASTDLPGFRARRSRHSKSRVLKALGALFTLGVLLVVWQGSIGGAFYGYGLDNSEEHASADLGRDLTTEKGEIAKNNPQVGKEKASLVMLVRYACFFSFRHQHRPVLFLAKYQLIVRNIYQKHGAYGCAHDHETDRRSIQPKLPLPMDLHQR